MQHPYAVLPSQRSLSVRDSWDGDRVTGNYKKIDVTLGTCYRIS
jgi:hypothetical protein